jgi:hypothetical protein
MTFRGLFNPGILIGALVVGGGLALTTILIINWDRPPRAPVGVVTAALTVVPVPTVTPTSIFTEPTENPNEPQAPPAGELAIGAFVKITGTEGSGLRLRSNPGLGFEPLFLGMEDEIFKIEAGPQEADGYEWWYLVAPFESERNGWAVSNYLEPDQEP